MLQRACRHQRDVRYLPCRNRGIRHVLRVRLLHPAPVPEGVPGCIHSAGRPDFSLLLPGAPGQSSMAGAALIDEILRELQVFVILCRLIETHKRHLSDLMSRIALAFAFLRSEVIRYIIGIAAGGIEKLILSGRLIIGYRAFKQVSEAVQLMIVFQIGKILSLPFRI